MYKPTVEISELAVRRTEPTLTQAVRDVLTEHYRQIEARGVAPERADKDLLGDALVLAAVTYTEDSGTNPWTLELLKPTTTRRDLLKAGALILAAIEQIDRRAVT